MKSSMTAIESRHHADQPPIRLQEIRRVTWIHGKPTDPLINQISLGNCQCFECKDGRPVLDTRSVSKAESGGVRHVDSGNGTEKVTVVP